MKKSSGNSNSSDETVVVNTKSGYLSVYNHLKEWKKLWFIIEKNTIYAFLSPEDRTQIQLPPLSLINATVQQDNKDNKKLIITSSDRAVVAWLMAESPSEKDDWISVIQACSSSPQLTIINTPVSVSPEQSHTHYYHQSNETNTVKSTSSSTSSYPPSSSPASSHSAVTTSSPAALSAQQVSSEGVKLKGKTGGSYLMRKINKAV